MFVLNGVKIPYEVQKMNERKSKVSISDISGFQDLLLDWYNEHQRTLPWRSEPSLYGTVVSEFMLQQTRVATVLDYYQRWMVRFPGFLELAAADEDEVSRHGRDLGITPGLGIYISWPK